MQSLEKEAMTLQIHEIYIKATPEVIWDALTAPEWTVKYGHRALHEFQLSPGGKYRVKANQQMRSIGLPEVIIDGEVIEAHPPRRLVHTFRFLFSAANQAEGFTRVTWEIEPQQSGFCRLTVTHDLAGAPIMASSTAGKYNGQGGGGWAWILSDLKTLLETGKPLAD